MLNQGVAVAADDGIEPRIGLGYFHVVLNAAMRKQNHHIILVSKVLVLRKLIEGAFETHLFQVVGMRARNTIVADFNHADDRHLNALVFKGHERLDAEIDRVGDDDVGAEEGELGPTDVVLQVHDVAVPFVVAHGAKVEACLVHQFDHGVIDGGVLVVHGVARAVVACRKQHHIWVDGPQTVDHRGEFGEQVDVGVHVVDRQDDDFGFAHSVLIASVFSWVFRLVAKDEIQHHGHQSEQ